MERQRGKDPSEKKTALQPQNRPKPNLKLSSPSCVAVRACFLRAFPVSSPVEPMSDIDTNQKWIYQFSEPSDEALAKLGELFAQLPVLPYTSIRQRRRKGTFFGRRNEAFFEGSLENLLKALDGVLREDHAANAAEAAEAPYKFDYVVDSDASHKNVLLVLTRLYDDEIEGSILYGGPVMRIAKDYYIAWD